MCDLKKGERKMVMCVLIQSHMCVCGCVGSHVTVHGWESPQALFWWTAAACCGDERNAGNSSYAMNPG